MSPTPIFDALYREWRGRYRVPYVPLEVLRQQIITEQRISLSVLRPGAFVKIASVL